MIDKSINEHEVLRYGKYVLDEQMFDGLDDRRMRVIVYERHVYYHKMVNGETVEFRKWVLWNDWRDYLYISFD